MLNEYKLHTEFKFFFIPIRETSTSAALSRSTSLFSDCTSETADSCTSEFSTMFLSSGTEVLTDFGSDCRVRHGGAVTE